MLIVFQSLNIFHLKMLLLCSTKPHLNTNRRSNFWRERNSKKTYRLYFQIFEEEKIIILDLQQPTQIKQHLNSCDAAAKWIRIVQ